ncbi:MAG: uncharacterized protein JWO86_2583 [Myxococcaceae bacterium]|nr:uncharacterized protein [Myxococcaceae bacterium]
MEDILTFSAFAGEQRVVHGELHPVLLALKKRFDVDPGERILVFEDATGRQVDFDLRGTIDQVLARALPEPPRAGPGRPKLGVISREVSLLPRHWDWLELQPNGASAALRRLVEEAKKRDPEGDRQRLAIEAASRFMTAMAGNLPHFEEASRALFAKDHDRFDHLIRAWPPDIRAHLSRLVKPASRATPAR